jgi:hypothetical protein
MKQYVRNLLTQLPALLFGLLLAVPAMAQTTAAMKGTVLDETGQPMVGVTVLLKDGQSTPRGTTTDAKGLFTFDNLRAGSRYDLTASYIGY